MIISFGCVECWCLNWKNTKNGFGSGFEFTYFFEQYFWGLVLLAGVAGLIFWIVKGEK